MLRGRGGVGLRWEREVPEPLLVTRGQRQRGEDNLMHTIFFFKRLTHANTIKTIARAFEAVTLPLTLLRGPLTHWVDCASFHINRLFVAWTLDVPQDRSAWAPILDNTNAVAACAPTAFSIFTAAINPTGRLTRSGLSAATRGGNPVRAPSGAPTSIPVA